MVLAGVVAYKSLHLQYCYFNLWGGPPLTSPTLAPCCPISPASRLHPFALPFECCTVDLMHSAAATTAVCKCSVRVIEIPTEHVLLEACFAADGKFISGVVRDAGARYLLTAGISTARVCWGGEGASLSRACSCCSSTDRLGTSASCAEALG